MKYFVSWTTRDPLYHDYDRECNVLISPANVPKTWSVSKWRAQPSELFIDSGAYSYRDSSPPSPNDVLKRQLEVASGWDIAKDLYLSHPDRIISPNMSFKSKFMIQNDSLDRARHYMELFAKIKRNATPIGVIHGFDEESIVCSYLELKEVGYKYFALGSASNLMVSNKGLLLKLIKIIQQYCIGPLHLFGITVSLDENVIIKEIASYDNASPSKLAFYGTVLYRSPLKRYIISPDSRQNYRDNFFRFREGIEVALPCECPICKNGDDSALILDKKSRAIHNYFQIKWETQSIGKYKK